MMTKLFLIYVLCIKIDFNLNWENCRIRWAILFSLALFICTYSEKQTVVLYNFYFDMFLISSDTLSLTWVNLKGVFPFLYIFFHCFYKMRSVFSALEKTLFIDVNLKWNRIIFLPYDIKMDKPVEDE